MALNEVTRTIAEQVQAGLRAKRLGEGKAPLRGIVFLTDGDAPYTLHVSLAQTTRARKFRNAKIRYNRGRDLYDVHVHVIDRQTYECETHYVEWVYAEDLARLLTEPLSEDTRVAS